MLKLINFTFKKYFANFQISQKCDAFLYGKNISTIILDTILENFESPFYNVGATFRFCFEANVSYDVLNFARLLENITIFWKQSVHFKNSKKFSDSFQKCRKFSKFDLNFQKHFTITKIDARFWFFFEIIQFDWTFLKQFPKIAKFQVKVLYNYYFTYILEYCSIRLKIYTISNIY